MSDAYKDRMDRRTRHALAGAHNFRDFGGYPAKGGVRMKTGQLFRSARLSELTTEDLTVLTGLGPRVIFDLRRSSEIGAAPTRADWGPDWAAQRGERPAIVHAPLLHDDGGPNTLERVLADPEARLDAARTREIMIDLYRDFVRQPTALEAYRVIFQTLAAPSAYPMIVHCSGGKDRTGAVCALIQGLAGVSRDDIISDFLLSQEVYQDATIRDRIPQVIDVSALGDWSADALIPVFTVELAYIETFLDLIHAEYGSIEAFLAGPVGLTASMLADVESRLLV